jgi:hypothetical protein
MYKLELLQKKQMTRSLPLPKNECQRSINQFWHCVIKYPVGCAGTVSHNRTIGPLSTEQWWWEHFYYVLQMSVDRASMTFGVASWKCMGCAVTISDNRAIGCLSRQKLLQHQHYYVLKISVNGVSMTFGLVSWRILGLSGDIKP